MMKQVAALTFSVAAGLGAKHTAPAAAGGFQVDHAAGAGERGGSRS